MTAHRVIDVYSGSQWESWLVVYADGKIKYRTENDGFAFLQHGVGTTDEWIDLAAVEQLEQQHGNRLIQQVEAALRELKGKA